MWPPPPAWQVQLAELAAGGVLAGARLFSRARAAAACAGRRADAGALDGARAGRRAAVLRDGARVCARRSLTSAWPRACGMRAS